MIHTRFMTPIGRAALAAGLALAFGACGGDDDADTGSSAATDAPEPNSAPTVSIEAPTTTSPTASDPVAAGDAAAFCAAELQLEAALGSEGDPSEAIAAASAAAPSDVAPTLAAVLAEFESSGGESEAFDVAYNDMIGWMKGNCGFGEIAATATEYAFAGIPEEVPAGPTVVSLSNHGVEFHELLMFRRNDGVNESFEEILALGEEESMGKVSMAGIAFAPTGGVGHSVVDLAAGDYLAICFLPTGATPELMAQMSESGPDGSLPPEAGPPHFTHGMQFEFTVTG